MSYYASIGISHLQVLVAGPDNTNEVSLKHSNQKKHNTLFLESAKKKYISTNTKIREN